MMIQSAPTLITACADSKPMQLPENFEPRSIDILCGRGRGVWEHDGNRHFKAMIEGHAKKYSGARTKMDKGVVIACLVDSIREKGILFVKKDTKTQRWFDIGEYKAREKTSHAMRDHIAKSNVGDSTKEVVHKKRQMHCKRSKTTQQPTVQNKIVDNQVFSVPVAVPVPVPSSSSVLKNNTVSKHAMDVSVSMKMATTPDIFQRLGLDYLSFFDGQTNEGLKLLPETVTSTHQSAVSLFDVMESQQEEEEALEWSELFPIEAFDDFHNQSTSFAYAA